MARNREFDPKEALEKAMMVFWQKGYVDTSIDDLVDATGVSRYGLYAENAVQAFFGIVEQAGAALPEIRLYFDKILDFYSQPAGKLGCLMCNSATEVAPHDQGVKEKVNGAMERMTTGFGVALTNAKKRGEVKSKLNIKQAADFLTGVLLGASVMVRSGANKKMIRNTVEMSLASL
jgi:hypothetical protein